MREILTIHLGQAGVGMGATSWEAIATEHNITEGINDFHNDEYTHMFTARDNGTRVEPRALFIDSDMQSIEDLRQTFTGSLMSEGQLIASKEDSAGVYARGKYCIGPNLVEEAMERVRRMAEECTALQGFYIQHSTAGGTGSALAELMLQSLAAEYPQSSRHTVSIYPGADQTAPAVSPYNVLLSSSSLSESSSLSLLYDNPALSRFARANLDTPSPSTTSRNTIIAQAICSLTAAFRLDGGLNTDMREMTTNLVPFARVNFIIQSLSPLHSVTRPYHNSITTADITYAAFDPSNCLASCSLQKGKILACTLGYRGHIIPKDVGPPFSAIKTRRDIQFVGWSAGGMKCGIVYQGAMKPRDCGVEACSRSSSLLANCTGVRTVLSKHWASASKMYKKRAFLHWFTGEGMEEGEIVEARDNMDSLISDYKDCEVEDSSE